MAPDFAPRAAWPALRLRAALLRQTREFFHRRGFLEVETPLLSADVVVDRHLEPIAAEWIDEPSRPTRRETRWLQTSPEFGMKRLLAAGAEAIYQITRAFRNGERGPLHNPEFTIVEWYAAGSGMDEGLDLLSQLAEELLGRGPSERLSYGDAFGRHAGVDPHGGSVRELRDCGLRHGRTPPEGLAEDDLDAWRDWLLVELVEPHLGRGAPTLLFDYPASQAALAQVRAGRPPVAERFELYVEGIELANGYHELLDAAELRRRIETANARRVADGRRPLPEDSRLLAAMRHGLPPATGVALGFDRVAMLAAGARTIDEVLAFPFEIA